MKQLINNILNAKPVSPPISYSKDIRTLTNDLLIKSPKIRPGINTILSKAIVRDRISAFLDAANMQQEFSHTVRLKLHIHAHTHTHTHTHIHTHIHTHTHTYIYIHIYNPTLNLSQPQLSPFTSHGPGHGR